MKWDEVDVLELVEVLLSVEVLVVLMHCEPQVVELVRVEVLFVLVEVAVEVFVDVLLMLVDVFVVEDDVNEVVVVEVVVVIRSVSQEE